MSVTSFDILPRCSCESKQRLSYSGFCPLCQFSDPEIIHVALMGAERGWLIFPCDPRTKQPVTSNGVHDATRNSWTIRDWWRRWPGAMIGIKCGRESGIFVVDANVDLEKGLDGLAALTQRFSKLPETITVKTPGGGRHFYWKYPDDTEIRNSTSKLAQGVNVHGEGGYVIGAVSRNYKNLWYEALIEVWPDPEPAPQALITAIVSAQGPIAANRVLAVSGQIPAEPEFAKIQTNQTNDKPEVGR